VNQSFPEKVYLTAISKQQVKELMVLLEVTKASHAIRFCIKFTYEALISKKPPSKKKDTPTENDSQ